jgi:hypothetical protein
MKQNTTRMSDGQDSKAPAWTQWDIEQAWLEVVAAREQGNIDAEALAMRRFSEGLRNSAMGAAGSVLMPLDAKIDALTDLFKQSEIRQKRMEDGVEGRADYFYQQFGAFLKNADARFDGYGGTITTVLEAVRSLGGLPAQVEDHEVRIVALETHGAPAQAVGELYLLRSELAEVRQLLIVTRRQLWLTWIPVAAFVLLVVLTIVLRGGR